MLVITSAKNRGPNVEWDGLDGALHRIEWPELFEGMDVLSSSSILGRKRRRKRELADVDVIIFPTLNAAASTLILSQFKHIREQNLSPLIRGPINLFWSLGVLVRIVGPSYPSMRI